MTTTHAARTTHTAGPHGPNGRAPQAPPTGVPPGDVAEGPPREPHTLAVSNAALRSGFVLLPRTVLHTPGLSRDAKLLYAVLLSYAWQEGSCFPGYDRLQEDLGCSVNSVTKYMQELERAGLISRRRRGLGKTTVYTIHDPAPSPERKSGAVPVQGSASAAHTQTHKNWDSGLARTVTPVPQNLRPEQDSEEIDSEEQQQPPGQRESAPPSASTGPAPASGDVVVALLLAQGVTKRIATSLVASHGETAIRAQLEYARYRAATKNPAGALVKAIREDWAPPQAWLDAKEHEAAVARQAEEEATRRAEELERRQRWEAMTPEERVQGPLLLWVTRQKLRGHEPTFAEIGARQAELIAQFASVSRAG